MAQFKEIDDYNFPFEIGVMRDRGAALKFADYLNSIGIKATAKPGFGANYSIYVANEADVSKAKLELLRFGNNPFAKAYNQAAWAQGKTPKRERTVSSRTGFLSFSMGTYTWSLASLTSIIEVICLLIFVLGLVPDLERALLGALSWYHWDQVVADFQVWRVLTPIFLHFGIIHILFNLVMFEAFARPIERHFGAWKLGYIILRLYGRTFKTPRPARRPQAPSGPAFSQYHLHRYWLLLKWHCQYLPLRRPVSGHGLSLGRLQAPIALSIRLSAQRWLSAP